MAVAVGATAGSATGAAAARHFAARCCRSLAGRRRQLDSAAVAFVAAVGAAGVGSLDSDSWAAAATSRAALGPASGVILASDLIWLCA